jgi:Tfp pilus assembly protein PilO
MSKLPKEKRDKIILVALCTVVACAALWMGLIRSQNTRLKAAREEVEKSRAQVNRGQETLKSKDEVIAAYDEVAARLQQRETAMAAPNDMYSWLIETLNKFRAGYRIEIPQFGRELPTEVGIFAKFPYRAALFSVRGTAHYHDFGRFLADFENAHPYIRVQNIELEPLADTPTTTKSQETLSFKMELLTLVRPIAP